MREREEVSPKREYIVDWRRIWLSGDEQYEALSHSDRLCVVKGFKKI